MLFAVAWLNELKGCEMGHLKLRSSILYGAVAIALSTLTGCSGSIFNSSSNNPGLKLSGRLVDGYVKNASVTLDINDDRICSPTEPKTVTDASGNFIFTAAQNSDGGQHMTCATGGIDLSTGLPLAGQLLAPPGATQITPLTSVVMAQINSTLPAPVLGTPSAASATAVNSASTTIATSLGLTTNELLNTDPMTSTNPALLQATVAVQVLTEQVAAIVETTTGAPSSQGNSIYQNAMNGVAAKLAALTTPVNSTTLSSITNSVVSATVTSTQTSLAAAAAANTSDAILVAASAKAATLAPASMAAFVTTSLSNLVNSVATSTVLATPGPTNPAAVAQSTVEIANAANLASSVLTTAVATGASATLLTDLATLGNTIVPALIATTNLATAGTASTTINTALTTFATAEPAAPVVPATTAASTLAATFLQNVVPITPIAVNGTTATNANGVPTVSTAAGTGITSATLNLGLAVPTTLTLPASADIAFEVIDGARQFTLVIKGLTVTPNGAGAFTLTVPASGATLTAYGVKAAGNTVNATVSQAVLSAAITSTVSASGSAITVNVGSLLTALGTANSGFSTLTSQKGTYTVTAAISGIPLAVSTTVAASTTTIAIPNTTNSVTGSSQSASVTVN